MKTCPKCLKSEPEITFGIARNRYDGKTPYCRVCWTLYIQQGRWDKGVKRTLPFFDRLWNSIEICAHGRDCPFCCWPWLKGRDKDGYGKMSFLNASDVKVDVRVTRTLYEVWHARSLPSEALICHYCDFPPCCNPHHFWLGDRISNRLDCVQKNRHAQGDKMGSHLHPELFPRGEAKPNAKLTEVQVLDIRARYAAQVPRYTAQELAEIFHVSKFAILCIIHRKTWKHI